MPHRNPIWLLASAATLLTTIGVAQAWDDTKYPNLSGQWDRVVVPGLVGQPSHDPTKGWGVYQQAPLTAEYRKIMEDSIADQEAGGHGNNIAHTRCVAAGMPWMMVGFRPLEFVVTPKMTYVLIADYDPLRRIYTDGRDFPTDQEPTFAGYSIGKWLDVDGDGNYDVLEVETRNFKGPRNFDPTGLMLHQDNQSVIKERISLDKADPDVLNDEITVIDNALTRPWTVVKKYRRNGDPLAEWFESICVEYNAQIFIGKENYYLSSEGYLMPAKKGQAPPDTRYFGKN